MQRLYGIGDHQIGEKEWLSVTIKYHESFVNVENKHVEPRYWEHYWHNTSPCEASKNYILNIREFVVTIEFRSTINFQKFVD
jgi:hypothetical protein